MKQKITIKLTPLNEWDPHRANFQICNKGKLLQRGAIVTRKLKSQKIPLDRTKAKTNI